MTRRDALDLAIAELAAEPPFAEVVGRLCCLRGVSTLTALGLTVELGDWTRFRPQSLGPFLGLIPSENSSGEKRRQGGACAFFCVSGWVCQSGIRSPKWMRRTAMAVVQL